MKTSNTPTEPTEPTGPRLIERVATARWAPGLSPDCIPVHSDLDHEIATFQRWHRQRAGERRTAEAGDTDDGMDDPQEAA